MPNLIATFVRIEPLIAETIKLLENATSSGAVQDFVSKIEDLATKLEQAIAAHKAPPATSI